MLKAKSMPLRVTQYRFLLETEGFPLKKSRMYMTCIPQYIPTISLPNGKHFLLQLISLKQIKLAVIKTYKYTHALFVLAY